MNRKEKIIKISKYGVLTNIGLVTIKIIIGLLSNSIAIIMDAINNITDVLSHLATIIGTYFASKKPDKEHPYGHGKIEHLTALSIGIIIIIAGIMCAYESVTKIINPKELEYKSIIVFLLAISIIAKIILGIIIKNKGQELKSDALTASGKDALYDAIITSSTLVGIVAYHLFEINIDGALGVIISIFVAKTGYEIITKSVNKIIGETPDNKLKIKLKNKINTYKEVLGSHDLILHQYGPEKMIGSIHIEINDKVTARQIHLLTRKISEDIQKEFNINLTIGIYAQNDDENEYNKIKKSIKDQIKNHKNIINFHGYYVDNDEMVITFDIKFDYNEQNKEQITKEIKSKLEKQYPKYSFSIRIDEGIKY